MDNRYTAEYGPHMHTLGGCVAELGKSDYRHRFGGTSWRVIDNPVAFDGPMLLVTLDLADPKLADLRVEGLDELPLASYLNCSVWWDKQVFRIDPASRSVYLVERTVQEPEPQDPEYCLPNPLPERSLRLRSMTEADLPLDEESWDRLMLEFTNGPNFIRILGPPVWIEEIQDERCRRSHPMHYIAGIGNEESSEPGGYLDGEAFFYGEGALYFLFCPLCREITVRCQCT